MAAGWEERESLFREEASFLHPEKRITIARMLKIN
jgi:hypothetical protein